ncbi:MAG: nitroreductase/quinone reductase family protein [Thermomicrobiales bacterium]|nr:nitroreductase/quinone reductase family protein [Thermomicrobiales bacterium]MCO5219445.1 nitroreductase/quinone reductase family protein [Thermomicrobiales bacterium]MCO5225644.1 nitroreductase/quinone reductase family protein [Thermomicrobiales bacterium]
MERYFNIVFGFLVGKLGLNLQGAEMLTVIGRKSGQPHTFPVNPLDFEGERYLLSARGEGNWVRNARAAGEITLHRGRNRSEWLVTEVSDRDLKVHIMHAYLQRWGWQVQSFMKLGKGSSLAEIEERIDEFPIMAIQEKS